MNREKNGNEKKLQRSVRERILEMNEKNKKLKKNE